MVNHRRLFRGCACGKILFHHNAGAGEGVKDVVLRCHDEAGDMALVLHECQSSPGRGERPWGGQAGEQHQHGESGLAHMTPALEVGGKSRISTSCIKNSPTVKWKSASHQLLRRSNRSGTAAPPRGVVGPGLAMSGLCRSMVRDRWFKST